MEGEHLGIDSGMYEEHKWLDECDEDTIEKLVHAWVQV